MMPSKRGLHNSACPSVIEPKPLLAASLEKSPRVKVGDASTDPLCRESVMVKRMGFISREEEARLLKLLRIM
jgi:hypothetical protein